MPPAARLGDQCTGHGCFPSRPSVQGSSDVIINGRPAHRQGDAWAVHCCKKSCHGGNLAVGSSTVITNGRQQGRVGDLVSCGSSVAVGSPNVFVGSTSISGPLFPLSITSGAEAAQVFGHGFIDDNPDDSDGLAIYPPLKPGQRPTPAQIEESKKNGVDPTKPKPPPSETNNNPPAGAPQGEAPTSCGDLQNPCPLDQRLSPNFTLANLSTGAVFSHRVCAQHGLTEAQIVCNLKNLAEQVLEPLVKKYGRPTVTSGFRAGSGKSQHERGQAADLQWPGISNQEYWDRAQWVKDNLNYDQFIFEHGRSVWFHLSFNTGGCRRQVLTMFQEQYTAGLQRHYA